MFSSDVFVPLPIRNLGDDYYTFEKEKYRAVGELSRNIYTLGDEVTVRVRDVNLAAREVIFEII